MIIAQISDPHLFIEAGKVYPRSEEELRQAVAHLHHLPARPDVVLLTGDCAHHGAAGEYDRLAELLRDLQAPVYLIPGEHDDRATMLAKFGPQGAQALDGFVQYVVDGWPVRLILLDTPVASRVGGLLSAAQLEWLEARLAERPEQPTLVAMHHPPFGTDIAAWDEIGLLDVDAFGDVIARHPQVEAVVAGHLHTRLTWRFRETVAHTCAATDNQALNDFLMVGVIRASTCLLHVWRSATGLRTYVSQIGDHGGVVDVNDGER